MVIITIGVFYIHDEIQAPILNLAIKNEPGAIIVFWHFFFYYFSRLGRMGEKWRISGIVK
jgi:hypothetical protein